MKRSIVIASIGILCLTGLQTQAALIEIAIESEVTQVHDPSNLLEGNVNIGDTITGSYKYDSETTASFPYQPNEAIYQHNNSPYGIFLTVGGFSFFTDNSNVDFSIGIEDGINQSDSDYFSVRSYNNIKLYNNVPVGTILLQLIDNTGQALSGIELPLTAPMLENWNFNHISIEGGERFGDFIINGNVTSAILVPEPASIIMFYLGFLYMKKIKSKTMK